MQGWLSWQLDSDLLAALVVGCASYVLCWIWLRRAGNHAASVGRLICWLSGLLVISMALMSRIDALTDSLFSVHMVQHVMLIDLAPPLLLLGCPLSIWREALAGKFAGFAARAFSLPNALVAGIGFILKPPVAWGLSTIILWVWHLPWLYDYALVHLNVHEFGEHLTLFLAFVIWWHPLIGSSPRFPYLATSRDRFLYLLAGMVPSVFLGIFILFWPHVLYTYYLGVPRIAGISAAFDQQLGALVMLSASMAVLFFMGLPLQYYDRRPLPWP